MFRDKPCDIMKNNFRIQVRKMVFVCDHCHFLFSSAAQPEQCPDCGKYQIRPASKMEQADFQHQLEDTRRDSLWLKENG